MSLTGWHISGLCSLTPPFGKLDDDKPMRAISQIKDGLAFADG
jgi:hypothetical protein